jgi:hypothetical protein
MLHRLRRCRSNRHFGTSATCNESVMAVAIKSLRYPPGILQCHTREQFWRAFVNAQQKTGRSVSAPCIGLVADHLGSGKH